MTLENPFVKYATATPESERQKNSLLYFERSLEALIEIFEKKQDLSFDGFVGDDPSGVACFGEYYSFNISDIYHDLKTQQPQGLIKEWFETNIQTKKKISYKAYAMGGR